MLLLCFLAIAVFAILPLAVGGCVRWPQESAPSPFCLIVRFTVGLAILSFLYAWTGLAGVLGGASVAVVTGLAVLAGLARGGRSCMKEWVSALRPVCGAWRVAARHDRALVILAMTVFALLSANVLIGSMHPDTSQDSMWYHLALPGQWAATGSIAPSPWVLPSNYPLATEALYAAVLTVSRDEVFCVLLYGTITVALLAAMVSLAFAHSGGRGATVVMLWFLPLVAVSCAQAPVNAWNDNFAALGLLVAFGISLEGLRGEVTWPGWRSQALMGFVLGTAVAAKLIVLASAGPLLLWSAAGVWRRSHSWRQATRALLVPAAFAALAYAPWAIRGWTGSGLPVFPLASGLFPLRPAYRTALDGSRQLNGLYALNLSGVAQAVRSALWDKPVMFLKEGDSMAADVLIIALAAIASTRARRLLRAQGVFLLALFYIYFLLKGRMEVIRYFSLVYPLAAVAAGLLAQRLAARCSRAQWTCLVLVLAFGCVGAFCYKQVAWANRRAGHWQFRPVLDLEDRLEYYRHGECGQQVIAGRALDSALPPDARVWLLGGCYPFFVHRDCVWMDEVVVRILQGPWASLGASDLGNLLREKGPTHVAVLGPGTLPGIHDLENAGLLSSIALPERGLGQCQLYRVVGAEAPAGRGTGR